MQLFHESVDETGLKYNYFSCVSIFEIEVMYLYLEYLKD